MGTGLLSRSGRSPLFGKRSVSKNTKVSPETATELARLAGEAHMSESEFIATLIETRAYGIKEVEKILRQRLGVVTGMAHE
jgi:hypothetical protein